MPYRPVSRGLIQPTGRLGEGGVPAEGCVEPVDARRRSWRNHPSCWRAKRWVRVLISAAAVLEGEPVLRDPRHLDVAEAGEGGEIDGAAPLEQPPHLVEPARLDHGVDAVVYALVEGLAVHG